MGWLEEAVRECLGRAASVLPPRGADRAGEAIVRARRVRRRQAAGSAVAVLAVTAVTGGVVAWRDGGPAQPRTPVEVAVDGTAFMTEGCGHAMRCPG